MADITPNTPEPITATYAISQDFQYLGTNTVTLNEMSDYWTIMAMESLPLTASPLSSEDDNVGLYKEKGYVDPAEVSPTQMADEAFKSIFAFVDVFNKQIGGGSARLLSKETDALTELIEILASVVSAILGLATGAFSFDLFSFIGSLLSALGLSGLASIFNAIFGNALGNAKKVQEQEEKVAKEQGKNIAAAIEATNVAASYAEGNQYYNANLSQIDVNVYNIKSNVSINESTPFKSIAANSVVQFSTDYVLTANYSKATHTHWTVKADHSYSFSTRHGTRYHSASVLEVAGSSEYIASTTNNYADVRWTQTGQNGLPITANIGDTILGLLKGGLTGTAVTGINIDVTSNHKLTCAKALNLNYGFLYAIDSAFTFINSGIALALAGLPNKRVEMIKDLAPSQVTKRPDPQAPVSVNSKTPEPNGHLANQIFEGFNLGQLITEAENTAQSIIDANPSNPNNSYGTFNPPNP
jgi:hypothetical protein